VRDWMVTVTGDRRLGGVPRRVLCGRMWAVLQIDRRTRARAVGPAVTGEASRAEAADRRLGRLHPQRGVMERLSSSLVLTLAASLMAIACVVTLA